jgi:hypothetical protein
VGRPKGALGVSWGDAMDEAAARLGVACTRTEAWEGGEGFETCQDFDHPVAAFGSQAFVRLIGKDGKVEGIDLTFRDCTDWGRLRDSVAAEFDISDEGGGEVYETWFRGEVVRLSRDEGEQSCMLTVTGARFGKAYASYTLARGIGELNSGLRS